jgi:hypothetical protein
MPTNQVGTHAVCFGNRRGLKVQPNGFSSILAKSPVSDVPRAAIFALTFDEKLLQLTARELQFALLLQLAPTIACRSRPFAATLSNF